MISVRTLPEIADALAHLADRFPNSDGRTVATIGNFDGIHLGHQAIMSTVLERARSERLIPAVLTFDPHPLRILAPDRAPRLLTTLEQKRAKLESMGIELLVTLPFDRSLADMEPQEFAKRIVSDALRARQLYLGPDFRFGRARSGDVAYLARAGEQLDFAAEAIEPVFSGNERISASRIRQALSEGDPVLAHKLLGCPFRLIGTIVHGEGRGTTMLVPTANLSPENEFLPPHGVYITMTQWDGRQHYGVTNIGTRPTFGDHRTVVETNLPGFEGDLYGKRVELAFYERLRDEKRFESSEQLLQQIQRDLEALEAWKSRSLM